MENPAPLEKLRCLSPRTLQTISLVAMLFAMCMSVNANANSQVVSFKGKNVPLQTVLISFEKQTGLSFFYNYALLKDAKPVTLDVRNVPLENVLHQILTGEGLSFYISGKTVFVVKVETTEKVNRAGSSSSPAITGTVVSENGGVLQGATVEIVELNIKGITGSEGEFDFKKLPDGKYHLAITYVGYERYLTQITVSDNPIKLFVSMQHSSNSLDNVQVIAYGTTTQRFNTGDVATVKAEDIEKQPVNNPLLALEGRVPGMFITQVTGFPGTGVQVQLRGINSISKGIDPLYIIDGVPYSSSTSSGGLYGNTIGGFSNTGSSNPFDYINPADIESINVLKDADATAIYGSRGANGVILITTKKGKAGRTKVDINYQSGLGKVPEKIHLLDTRQYLQMRHESFTNDNATPNPATDFDLTLWDTTRNIDWQKVLLGGTDHYNDIEAIVSGGTEKTQFLIGAGFHSETTVFPADYHDQKGSLHFALNNESTNKRFKISLTGLYTVDRNLLPLYDLTHEAMTLSPDAPPLYNADGSINWAPSSSGSSSWLQYSPAAQLALHDKVSDNNLVSNAVIAYTLLPGLDIKSSFGYTNVQMTGNNAIPLAFFDPAIRSAKQRIADFTQSISSSWIIEPQLTYARNLGGGSLNALIGFTIQQNNTNGQSLEGAGYNSDLELNNIQGATSIAVIGSINSIYKYNAGFGRVGYNWQNKYLINITGRRDGSSRFGPENQFHDFWAVGAGWLFSNEQFIKLAFPVLSHGKLRGSYGITGSDQVGDYTFMDLYTTVPNIGVPYQGARGLYPSRIFTPNLAWEETRKLEGGLELGFFKDRVVVTGSYYYNRSSNQLIGYSLPSITGFTQVSRNLNAIVQNRGAEFELKTINIIGKDFRWTTGFNISVNRNTLAQGIKGLDPYLAQKVGHPLAVSFTYAYLGVDPLTGVNQFADRHGQPTNNPNPNTDMAKVIDPSPAYYGGIQNSIRYKGFQLDFLFQFINKPNALIYEFNYIPGFFATPGGNQPIDVLGRWQRPGDVTNVARFSQNSALLTSYTYGQQSNQIFGDASYIRLKNASLSWQVPDRWKRKAAMQNIRLFIQGQNLLTFTRYRGLDPETMSSFTLPPLRVITAGINMTL